MKKLFSFVMLFVALLSVGTLAGCKKESTAKGYGMVQGNYVGYAEVTVKKDEIVSVSIDEVYLPVDWAITTETGEGLTVSYTGRYGAVVVAKYVVIDGKKFTGTPSADGSTVIYSTDGIADLKAYVSANEENAEWYAEAVLAGKAKATQADFTTELASYDGKDKGWTKLTTDYWPATYGGLGYKANIEALNVTFVGSKLGINAANIKNGTDGKLDFDGIKSESTVVAGKDYYNLVLNGYNKATK